MENDIVNLNLDVDWQRELFDWIVSFDTTADCLFAIKSITDVKYIVTGKFEVRLGSLTPPLINACFVVKPAILKRRKDLAEKVMH